MNNPYRMALLLTLGMLPGILSGVVLPDSSKAEMAAPLFACHRQFFADFYGDIYRGFGEFYMRNPVFPVLYVGRVQGHQTQTRDNRPHACKYDFSAQWTV